ncbi:MAG: pyridoxal-phosphate dependent enzyme [Bacteroidota bacterium]
MNSLLISNEEIHLSELKEKQIRLFIKREDTIHPFVSGNKYRKLKYNLIEAKNQGHARLLTFGGAYSNHIAATAYAGKKAGFKTIGVIRGEELKNTWQNNPTLKQAHRQGMQFHFVSREAYRNKNHIDFLTGLEKNFGPFYLIPEGGTNDLAVKGCEEILTKTDAIFDVICCCVGTGGTISGLINSARPNQMVLGFPALKGDFLKQDILKFARNDNWKLKSNYHFGGYAKVDKPLIQFINTFKSTTGIPLDPIYTGKMMFGILDLIQKNFFKQGYQILAIHSGGLQGIQGMNLALKRKNLPELDI